MKVLLVGSGGREHALAWGLANSQGLTELYAAPGNAGIEQMADCVPIGMEDIEGLVTFALEKDIDFVVVGPEAPLVAGLVDALNEKNIPAFGPDKKAAILEGSKGFVKDLCKKYNIPTAAYERFSDVEKAKAYVDTQKTPVVVKADGLAAGKGVIIAETHEEAKAAIDDMLSGNAFGSAGSEVVIEEFMDGEELSFFALADGKSVTALTSAQDHKRVGDGDTGPNTGGMGAYSPAHFMTKELHDTIMDTIIHPTVKAMEAEGRPYKGVLFAGLMMVDGVPKLIEFNARFGDPETQPIMTRLKADLLGLLYACATGKLDEFGPVEMSAHTALCVVMAAKGYPGAYDKGTVIKGVDKAGSQPGMMVFHAGTKKNEQGALVSNGGRVLNIVAGAMSVKEAQQKAYDAIDLIDWPEGFCRRDIGYRAIKK